MEILLFLGIGIAIIGGLWLLVVAFSESVLWGLGCLLIGPVSIVFIFMHWEDAKNPFFTQLAGLGIVLIAAGLDGSFG